MNKHEGQPARTAAQSAAGGHAPVLRAEVVDALRHPGGVFIDATVGDGGHALSLLKSNGPTSRLLGIDLDPTALGSAQERLQSFQDRVVLVQGTFAKLHALATRHGMTHAHGILFDLGLRSSQLASGRGFSFRPGTTAEPRWVHGKALGSGRAGKEFSADGSVHEQAGIQRGTRREPSPLDMRFDPTGQVALPAPRQPGLQRLYRRIPAYTAAQVLAQLTQPDLAEIFRVYGDERFAERIADAIVRTRRQRPLHTTDALVELVVHAMPPAARHGRLHAATRVFQALRIAVNRERESLEAGLEHALGLLAPGGRLAVISYHSGEDRVVKHQFREWAKGNASTLLTKHPIVPSAKEQQANPRSRSAKLRVLTHTRAS